MSSKVVHDTAALFAVDHISIEPALFLRGEDTNAGDGLAAKRIAVSIVLDGEEHVLAVLWKHDAAPGTMHKNGSV